MTYTSTSTVSGSSGNTAATGTSATAKTQEARNKLSGSYDNFLKMLTTQLQYQDPMQPMDSAQFTNQLVMYSQVEQQIAQSEKLDKLINMQGVTQTQGALSFIGMNVEANGSTFSLDGKPVNFAYNLPENADSVKVRILDSSGKLVATLPGEVSSGRHDMTWDGKNSSGSAAKSGQYSFEVVALRNGKIVKSENTVKGIITGIDSSSSDTVLLLGETQIKIDNLVNASKAA